jgi:predicted lactoylglutathione lyase
MLSYLFFGANDVDASANFYEAILFPLGYERKDWSGKAIFTIPCTPDEWNGPGAVYVAKPYDGKPATVGNGTMAAFRAKTRKEVDICFAAGVVAGGEDDGAPGIREEYSDNFYVAYLRDPAGNKIALFCNYD